MSGNSIFVDTNILLYFLKGDKEVVEILANNNVVISFVTELELLSFSKLTASSEKVVRALLKDCLIVNINSEIKDLTIAFRKKSKIKLPDAIIAASSFYHKLPLFTADKQFRTVEELDVIIYEV